MASLLEINYDEITLGEVEDVERLAERSFQEIAEEITAGKPCAKTLIALVYVIKRRTDPEYTIEQARSVQVKALRDPDAVPDAPAPKEDALAAPGV